jgi:hypothetical protein
MSKGDDVNITDEAHEDEIVNNNANGEDLAFDITGNELLVIVYSKDSEEIQGHDEVVREGVEVEVESLYEDEVNEEAEDGHELDGEVYREDVLPMC